MSEADEKLKLVNRDKGNKHKFKIDIGFVANMNVPAYFFANPALEKLMFDEYSEDALIYFNEFVTMLPN